MFLNEVSKVRQSTSRPTTKLNSPIKVSVTKYNDYKIKGSLAVAVEIQQFSRVVFLFFLLVLRRHQTYE